MLGISITDNEWKLHETLESVKQLLTLFLYLVGQKMIP